MLLGTSFAQVRKSLNAPGPLLQISQCRFLLIVVFSDSPGAFQFLCREKIETGRDIIRIASRRLPDVNAWEVQPRPSGRFKAHTPQLQQDR
jgi:hypothetical protein